MTDLTLQVFVDSASEATITLQASVAQICHFLPICDLIFFFPPRLPTSNQTEATVILLRYCPNSDTYVLNLQWDFSLKGHAVHL